jgi:uncharacterized protein DUF4328
VTSEEPDFPPHYFGPPATQPPPAGDPVADPGGYPHPGQPYPGQQYPGQPYSGQPYPGQPYSGQPYPGGQYPGQPYPGQPYPGQPYPGQPYPGQPYPGPPYPGPPYPGQPYPGPPYWGPPLRPPGPVGSPGRLRGHRIWATLAQLSIVAAIAAQVVVLHALSAELSLARRVIADPLRFGDDGVYRVQHDYDQVRAWSAVLIVLLVLAAACFIVWLYRLRSDVETFAPHQGGLSRGWAIGGWFIPLANAVLPFLVVRDVIRAAVADAPQRQQPAALAQNPGGWMQPVAAAAPAPGRARQGVYVVAGLWWGLWILGGVGARLVNVPSQASLSQLEHAFGQMQLWTVVQGLAAVLAVAVIEILTRADRRSWARIGS